MKAIKHDCRSIRDLLVDYADGELAAAESDRVAAHIGQCQACRSELRLLQRSLDLAQEVWRESAVSSSSEENDRVPQSNSRVPRLAHPTESTALLDKPAMLRRRWAMPVAVVAAVLLLVGGVVWLAPHAGPMPPKPEVLAQKSEAAAARRLRLPSCTRSQAWKNISTAPSDTLSRTTVTPPPAANLPSGPRHRTQRRSPNHEGHVFEDTTCARSRALPGGAGIRPGV